jgi:predicted TIM-barrel fold metal-dependent hydrolase
MDKINISKSILSITSPGTFLKPNDNELARQVTRETNDEIADICRKYPDRFGFFASLPLPDVEDSLKEIDRALDVLGASGFAIMTNAQGYYPGDPELDRVFKKLNERKAVIFMHPTDCCTPGHTTVPKPLNKYPTPMMEYFFDTTRAVVNLLLSGTVTRYQNLIFLVSHCGATIPPLVERFTSFNTAILKKDGLSSTQVKELFRTRFYFDLAGFPFPDLIHGYLTVGDPSRLLYGSDYPYTPESATLFLSQQMDDGLKALFEEETIAKIYGGNARQFLNL